MITLEFTRVILAVGVFAIGVELPKAYMKRHWKSLFFLLVPVMTWVRDNLSLENAGFDVLFLGMAGFCRLHLRPHPGSQLLDFTHRGRMPHPD